MGHFVRTFTIIAMLGFWTALSLAESRERKPADPPASGEVIGKPVAEADTSDMTNETVFPNDRGWLGVEVANMNRATAEYLGWTDYKAIVVISTVKGAPSDGILARGDVLFSINGDPVQQMTDLVRPVSNIAPGTDVSLGVFRGGVRRNLSLTVGGFAQINSQLAAEQDPDAVLRFADAHRIGHAVPVNLTKAYELYQQAWSLGNAGAGYWAARMLEDGEGVAADEGAAASLMQAVAATGFALAVSDDAFRILEAGPTSEEIERLVKVLQDPGQAEDGYSHYLLGFLYEGEWDSQLDDPETALTHFQTAVRIGFPGAEEVLEARGATAFPLRETQARLALLGLYDGQVDGINGPGTQAAVSAFQALIGVRQTGALDREQELRLHRIIEGENFAAPVSGKKSR